MPDMHLACDVPPELARDRVTRNQWERATHGAYVPTGTAPTDLVIARAVGVHHRMSARHAFSHETAAVLHGLAVWRTPERTHLRHEHRSGSSSARDVARHFGFAPSTTLVERLGLPVTDLATTVWDCLTSLPALDALVVADDALHVGLAREQVEAIADRATGRGTRRGRQLLALADDGAESARETWTRLAFLAAGWPAPETQVRVETAAGVFWADLGWTEWRVLVEYDGVGKYLQNEHALLAEKRRRDAIAEVGWHLVHVTKADTWSSLRSRVARYVPADVLRTARPHPTLTSHR